MDPRLLLFTQVDHSKKEVQIHYRGCFENFFYSFKAYSILDNFYYKKLFLSNYSLAFCEYQDFPAEFSFLSYINDIRLKFNIGSIKYYTIISNLDNLFSFPDWLSIIPSNSYPFYYFQSAGWDKSIIKETRNPLKQIEKPLSFVTLKPRLGKLYMTGLVDIDEKLYYRGALFTNKKNLSTLKERFSGNNKAWEAVEKGYSKLPHNNISDIDFPDGSTWDARHTAYPSFYNKSFCHFTFETLSDFGLSSDPILSEGLFLTEKTAKVIIRKKPFIVYANPGFYKLLHKEGFKTFNKFWDESFDSDYNLESRTKKYLNVIEQIKSMSIKECMEMHVEMEEILEHNFQNMLHLMNSKDKYGL